MLSEQLAQRQAEGRPIRVGVIGAGKFGGGLVAQLFKARGMEACVVADSDSERARRAHTDAGRLADDIREVASVAELNNAIASGGWATVEDGSLLATCDELDVVVEATGIPEIGARHACAAIDHGKHIVMVTIETDVTVGAALKRRADKAGVVYTLVDGDQPGCIMNMVDWARTVGFEIVAAGRGTILRDDDATATPDSVQDRYAFDDDLMARRNINTKMFNSFRDGTKAQLEMTALANMTGLPPDVRGMHEPPANLEDIPRLFSLEEEGGMLSRHGVVELANSVAADGESMLPNPLRMGVFLVIRADHPFIEEDLAGYGCHPGGNGNFLLYRPYHLVAVEAPISIARAVLYGVPTGAPLDTPAAELITVAKRHLKKGEMLDGGGGYTVNGLIEKAEIASAQNLLPLGLSPGATLLTDIEEGGAIGNDVVKHDEGTTIFAVRREQDALVAEHIPAHNGPNSPELDKRPKIGRFSSS